MFALVGQACVILGAYGDAPAIVGRYDVDGNCVISGQYARPAAESVDYIRYRCGPNFDQWCVRPR